MHQRNHRRNARLPQLDYQRLVADVHRRLAPAGKTGLIISVLFDYRLTKYIQDAGWYEEFKTLCEQSMLDVLDGSIYPGMRGAVLQRFSSTPVTMARHAGTTEGAIVGWAFSNEPMPAENRLIKIMNAVRTPIPGVLQAGQWTYNPPDRQDFRRPSAKAVKENPGWDEDLVNLGYFSFLNNIPLVSLPPHSVI